MTTDKSMILSESITDNHHVLCREAIEADIQVQQVVVLHKSLAPFPRGDGTLKLFDAVSEFRSDIFFFFEIVLKDGSLDGS